MATRETQKRIVDAAIELFNTHGSSNISANRIADVCGVSRGNLYYHFNNKEEIIHAIYIRMANEVKFRWVNDLEQPTVTHMLEMFDRQLALIWRYRFFYREMMALLAGDEHLQQRFSKDRHDRTLIIIAYAQALIKNDVLLGPNDARELENLVKLSWILSDNWINYTSVDNAVYPDCMSEGYELLIDLFRPYMARKAVAAFDRSQIIRRVQLQEFGKSSDSAPVSVRTGS